MLISVAAAIDHIYNERKRQISGQLATQRPVVFQRERTVMLGKTPADVLIDDARREASGTYRGWQWARPSSRIRLGAGREVWRGTIDGEPRAVQMRPLLNGFHAGLPRHRSRRPCLHTARGGACFLDAGAQAGGHSKSLLCPMPGLVRAIFVTEGKPSRRANALHDRSDEDGKRPACRRDVTVKKIAQRRASSSRRGDHGLCLNARAAPLAVPVQVGQAASL